MGAGLALNLVDNGWEVVGFNRHAEVARAMEADGLIPAETLRDLAAQLRPPRVIWLMVPSGAPVDELLFGPDGESGLSALLAPATPSSTAATPSSATTSRARRDLPSSASTSWTRVPAADRRARATARRS